MMPLISNTLSNWFMPWIRAQGSATERERRDTLWLLAAFGFILLPILPHLPFWAQGVTGLCFALRLRMTLRNSKPMHWGWLLMASAIIFGLEGWQYKTFAGREAGVTLLVCLMGLKMLEMKARRDLYVMLSLSFFVLLTTFFHSQSMFTAAFALGAVAMLFGVIISNQHRHTDAPASEKFMLVGSMLLRALPLAAIFFIAFPRVSGPLWGLPQESMTSTSGLSDSMSPGDITKLSLNEEVAFRVKFEGQPPPKSQLYWRGPVLSRFDGRRWSMHPPGRAGRAQLTTDPNSAVRYEVTLEPTNRIWAMALEVPNNTVMVGEQQAMLTPDLQLVTSMPLRARTRYLVESHMSYVVQPQLSDVTLATFLDVQPGFNPRSLQFAADLQNRVARDAGTLRGIEITLAQAVMQHFRTQQFAYTLEPPPLGVNSVDDFMFTTKAGFCEHYAQAFVVIMRAMSVPARVVTGYQGGEINPVDGFLTVRQSDAHAWAEIYVRGQGWQRVDPTAAVSPDRISLGIGQTLARPQGLFGDVFSAQRSGLMTALKQQFDAIQNSWNQWILSYDNSRQKSLFQNFGISDVSWQNLMWVLMVGGGLAGLIAAATTLINRAPQDRIWALYLRAEQRAGRVTATVAGPRQTHEGVLEYAARIRPMLDAASAQAFDRISQLICRIRYQPAVQLGPATAELEQCVKQFSPKLNPTSAN